MTLNDATLSDLSMRLEGLVDRCGPLPVSREDLVGEVILRLLVADEKREISNPYGYARTILQNLIRDHLRRAERAQRALESLATTSPRDVPGDEEAERVDDDELLGFLLERTKLSPLQAKVLRMVYLDNMTLSEVALELSKNPGTILRHVRRALAKLGASAAELELQR